MAMVVSKKWVSLCSLLLLMLFVGVTASVQADDIFASSVVWFDVGSMTMVGLRGTWTCASDRCFRFFPCLSDPAWRSSFCLKVALVMLHLIYVGILFLFNTDLIEKTRLEPWYTALYLLLFVATLAQYFLTARSSPGYVLDAMRAANESVALFRKTTMTSKQPASRKNGSVVVAEDGNQSGRNLLGSSATSWTKLVMEMYSPGSSVRVPADIKSMTVSKLLL